MGSGLVDWESSQSRALLNPRMPEADVRHLLTLFEASRSELPGHLYLATSGTTRQDQQRLKWVCLSKSAFLASAAAVNNHLESTSQDCWAQSLPEFHVGGLGIRARAHLSGAPVVEIPKWHASHFIEQVQMKKVTLAALVPTQIFDLIRAGHPAPSSLRAVVVGGGALSALLYQQARTLNWPLLPSYGMTEACSQIATSTASNSRLQPLPHIQLRVSPTDCIEVKGPSLLTAYVSEEGSQAHVHDPKKEGWFLSNDRGQILEDGSLRVLGRVGDFFKMGGESVELSRLRIILEEIKTQHPTLTSDVELIPLEEERLGHVVALLSDSQLSPSEADHLIIQFNQKVLPFERIRQWKRVEKIQRTELGKLKVAQTF